MKRVFIVHGWDGYPEEGWFPWLKKELEKKNFKVLVPAMPEPAEPKIKAWVSRLSKIVGTVDKNTFFVGHSIGCQTIMRYFAALPKIQKVGGAVFVAGWFNLVGLETNEEKKITKPWLKTKIDFKKVKNHGGKYIAIFSDNDPFVPPTDKKIFAGKLGAKTIVEHKKGHFSGNDGIIKLPIALKSLLKIAR